MSTDLIKRIETLEKQMSMIDAMQTPQEVHGFKCGPNPPIHTMVKPKQKSKFATGRLVEGLDEPIEHEKHVEFTEWLSTSVGWVDPAEDVAEYAKKVVYLGKCMVDGDIFAVYDGPCIEIYKGHLNSGTY